ncbi:MAG: hypothetical protein ABGY96_04075 [bacterium]
MAGIDDDIDNEEWFRESVLNERRSVLALVNCGINADGNFSKSGKVEAVLVRE